jgi:hypothetical protein
MLCALYSLLCPCLLQGLSPKDITDKVIACRSADQLVQVIQQHIDDMTAYNLPAAIWKLSKLKCADEELYMACMKPYMRFAQGDSARNLSNVVYSLCTAPPAIKRQHLATVQEALLPAFLAKLSTTNAQSISNVLYGIALSGQQLKPGQLQQLLDAFVAVKQAKPQEVSNALWAVATMRQQVPAEQLQELLDAFLSMLQQAKPQELSNTLWAVVTMGQQMPAGQLQQLLNALVDLLPEAGPQAVSNSLWAVAIMGQQVPEGQLQQLLDALVDKLKQATPQAVSNTLLACAKLSFLPQQLLAAPGLAGLLAAGTPQALANAAWACGQLGHRDEQLMGALLAAAQQLLKAAPGTNSGDRCFNSQGLCNLCWAVAVLDLQQHAQLVLQLAQACSSMWGSTVAEHQQLWQVHTWLLDFQLAGGQGLQGSLTEQQLQQCRAAWKQALHQTAKEQQTDFQCSVFAAVQRLGIAWQQQPQMEQLSVGRDGVTPDGALLLDIAGRTAAGVLVAVEADGPWHFRRPDGGLMGTTQYRNRALAVRGYRLVSVPKYAWDKVWNDEQRQEQYLMRRFEEAGVINGQSGAQPNTHQPAASGHC